MDELVNVLPPGVHLTELTQQGRNVDVIGTTQSNQRISNLMRSVEESEWLRTATLGRIEATDTGPVSDGQFRLRMQQVPMSDEEAL
jgi:type IV pilus assembly protein PilN